MRRPTDAEEIVLIAVLRVLNVSQDAVSSILHVSKNKVNDTDKWLKEAPIHEVRDCLDDRLISEVVQRDLPHLAEVSKDNLARAFKVTALQILAHYQREWKPVDAETWKRHWDDLAETAGKLVENLGILMLQDDHGQALYEIEGDVVEGGIAEMDSVMEGMWGDIFESRRRLEPVDRLFASCLISHLGIPVKKWNELTVETVSREIIHGLELAARRRTFEGTCEICAGWSR